MLVLIRSFRHLRFGELTRVYEESIRKQAEDTYSDPEGFGLLQAEDDFRLYLQQVFFGTEGAVYGLWEVKGSYAAAVRLEPYRDGFLVSALETAPGHRGKGYATRLLMGLAQTLVPGAKLYSHVGKKNLPSRRVHEKAGFQLLSDRAVYLDGSVDSRCDTYVNYI